MITITRKLAGIVSIQQLYFPADEREIILLPSSVLVGVTQSTIPIKGLQPLETLHIDLTKNEEGLLMDISRSTRKQIYQADRDESLLYIKKSNPTDEEILNFQSFYNEFAAKKHTYQCKAFHVKTIQLLRDQQALFMTRMEDINGQIYCYRVYVVDGKRATSLYSCSHFRLSDDPKFKRQLSKAHRLLKWKDMIHFKQNGYHIYDSGGLTGNKNIRNFKLEMGGIVVTEYSGYLPLSMLGNLVLGVRNWKMSN